IAQRMLRECDALKDMTSVFHRAVQGAFTIATTHRQARYALSQAVKSFMGRFPLVQLALHQGCPSQVCVEAATGEADLAIATEAVGEDQGLVVLPCYECNRSVIAPLGHPILDVPQLTLEDVASYPIVTYAFAFAAR